jgi:hypothetical protein
MTPLAQKIIRELELKPSERTIDDRCGLLAQMGDIHCFECSKILEMARHLARWFPKIGLEQSAIFLPCPRTWIEYRDNFGQRQAALLSVGLEKIEVMHCTESKDGRLFSDVLLGGLPFVRRPAGRALIEYQNEEIRFEMLCDFGENLLLACLALINTPKITGRRSMDSAQFGPTAQPKAMMFPLNAWTEIVLNCSMPDDAWSEAPCSRKTGKPQPWHYRRAYRACHFGREIHFEGYYAGNPAFGIRLSKYRVETKTDAKNCYYLVGGKAEKELISN